MPLAIIGNEYSDAWQEVTTKLQVKRNEEIKAGTKKYRTLFRKSVKLLPIATASASIAKLKMEQSMLAINAGELSQPSSSSLGANGSAASGSINNDKRLQVINFVDRAVEEKTKDLLSKSVIMVAYRQVRSLLEKMEKEESGAETLSPMILLYLCEVKGWMASLLLHVEPAIEANAGDLGPRKPVTQGRRLSAFGGGGVGALVKSEPEDEPVAPSRLQRTERDDEEEEEQTTWSWIMESIFGKEGTRYETEHTVMMEKIAREPTALRNRMWMLLNLHDSSRFAFNHFSIFFFFFTFIN